MEARVTLAINKTVKQEKRIDLTDPDESVFWKAVSEVLLEAPIPCTMTVEYGGGSAELDAGERGTYFDNGIELPSMFVTPIENNISLPPATYAEAYLTCISPETKGGQGSYKFYRFVPTPAGIEAEYGRIGTNSGRNAPRKVRNPYPSWMYWVKYYEKIRSRCRRASFSWTHPSSPRYSRMRPCTPRRIGTVPVASMNTILSRITAAFDIWL